MCDFEWAYEHETEPVLLQRAAFSLQSITPKEISAILALSTTPQPLEKVGNLLILMVNSASVQFLNKPTYQRSFRDFRLILKEGKFQQNMSKYGLEDMKEEAMG